MLKTKFSASSSRPVQVDEGDFRLDHPELGQMPAGLAFSARKVGPKQ
jgi:hypothetical protein